MYESTWKKEIIGSSKYYFLIQRQSEREVIFTVEIINIIREQLSTQYFEW